MSDEEAEARINALRNNARRGVKLMTSSRVPASYSNIPRYTPSPIQSQFPSVVSSYTNHVNVSSFEENLRHSNIDFISDNMPTVKPTQKDDKSDQSRGEKLFDVNNVFRNAPSEAAGKMLIEAFFPSTKMRAKAKLGGFDADDEAEPQYVERFEDADSEIDIDTLPAEARELYLPFGTEVKPPLHRRKLKKLFTDRIRLPETYYIRPEDVIDQGPEVSYDEVVTIRGGGNELYPNVEETLENLVCPEILKNLDSMGIKRLRRIQEHIIPLMIDAKCKQDLVVSAPTGNGKTLGYLISIIHMCAERKRQRNSILNAQRKPKAAILLQNHETAQQVFEMACKIAQDLELFIIPAIGSNNTDSEIRRLKIEGGDLVVGTTGRFIDYISGNKIPLDHLEVIIFDEADQFLKDKCWEDGIKTIKCHMPANRRFFLFSATYDDEAMFAYKDFLKQDYWFVAVGELNQVEKLVKQNFLVEKRVAHDKLLIKLLIQKAKNGKCPKTLVFCNTIDRAEWLAGRLRLFRDIPCPFKIKVSALHSSVPPTDRHLIFHGFRLPPEDPYTIDVIVASDKLSCGISTPAELVINYDVPYDVSTYVLRVGRTGRNGHRGEAFTFIDEDAIESSSKKETKDLYNILTLALQSETAPLPQLLQNFYAFYSKVYCH